MRGDAKTAAGPHRQAASVLRDARRELARLRRIRGASRRTWRRIARAEARVTLAAALLAGAAAPAAAAVPRFHVGFRFDESLFWHVPTPRPAFADLDADGDPDLAVGTFDGDVFLLENTGSPDEPLFGPATLLFENPRNNETAPASADIDGDGDLDAFLGNEDGDTLFFRNLGSATSPDFASVPETNPFGLADVGTHASPTLGDVDGDGDLDAFVGNLSGDVLFFENTGSATAPAFAPPVSGPFGLPADIGGYLSGPTLVDVDGDGDLDLFIFETTLCENTGTVSAPAFAAPVTRPFGFPRRVVMLEFPAFADVDGDGDLDAVIGAYAGDFFGDLQAFVNTGSVTAPAFAHSPPSPADIGGPIIPYRTSDVAPAVGDLDADGDLDVLVGRRDGGIWLYRNSGSVSEPVLGLLGSSNLPFGLIDVGDFVVPQLGDLDGDGDLDLLVGTGSGNLVYFANTGSASAPAFGPLLADPFGLADVGFYAAPALADLDGDGDLDVYVGRGNGTIAFFENTGTANAPAFTLVPGPPFGLTDVGQRAVPSFGDVDVDGDLDALIGSTAGDLFLFTNTGTATAPAFAAPIVNPPGLADVGASAAPALADVDGDGDLDAYVGTSVGRVVFAENVAVDPDACTDGLDNDGDGRIDFGSDPGCASAADTSELSALQCDNGLDDDGDGLVDLADPHCTGPLDDREAPTQASPGCGLGPELLGLAPLLAARRRRRGGLISPFLRPRLRAPSSGDPA
jgi:hypothetical protein